MPGELPRAAVSPDGWAMLGADAGQEVLVVEPAPFGEGPITLRLGVTSAEPAGEDDFPCTGNLRLAPEWTSEQAIGRSATALPSDSERYAKLIGDALGHPDPGIVALWRLDLEGDGTDEVLFEIHEEDTRSRYSAVGLRKIGAGGEVETLVLHEASFEAAEDDPDGMRGLDAWVSASLWGLTDVDGDGELEVVLAMSGWESYGHQVVDATGRALGGAGCGV